MTKTNEQRRSYSWKTALECKKQKRMMPNAFELNIQTIYSDIWIFMAEDRRSLGHFSSLTENFILPLHFLSLPLFRHPNTSVAHEHDHQSSRLNFLNVVLRNKCINWCKFAFSSNLILCRNLRFLFGWLCVIYQQTARTQLFWSIQAFLFGQDLFAHSVCANLGLNIHNKCANQSSVLCSLGKYEERYVHIRFPCLNVHMFNQIKPKFAHTLYANKHLLFLFFKVNRIFFNYQTNNHACG